MFNLFVLLAARNHVNRMCLAADVPLVESGTAGYLGQATVIKKVPILNNSFHVLHVHIYIYYMEESVLLGTKPLVDSIRHFIWDPSGVLSI